VKSSPEIKGRPDPGEKPPKKQPSPETAKQVGKVALKGAQKKDK